ncbi:MAG: DUF1552 domain-containing protein [Planctomycetaceae bacterium]|nr:DUF1552 domain-containing protein [Planctomycetaceae bacterium]
MTLVLPWLESLATWGAESTGTKSAGAKAAGPAKRFACLFMANGVEPGLWGAQGNGRDMVLKSSLEPLEPLKEHLLVLNGLYNPKSLTGNIHIAAAPNVLSGAHVVQSTSDLMVGTSFDQLLAAEIGGQTMFPSLVLGIEPPTLGTHKGYSCIYSGPISWSTPKTPVPRENNPRALYDRLVGDPRGLRKAKSVLDLVMEDARGILPRVSAWDRQRLDEYLASVREVEQRLSRLPEKEVRTGPRVDELIQPPDAQEPPSLADHMRLMLDLLAIAFATDSTRVGTLMFNNDLSRMDFGFLRPGSSDLTNMHGMSHAGGPDYALMNRFHIEMYAHLLKRLQGYSEGETTVLDNSCVMFCSSLMSGGAHDRTQMPVLLAGRLGQTLKTGRTLTYSKAPEEQRRLCNLFAKLSGHYALKSHIFGDSAEPLRDL